MHGASEGTIGDGAVRRQLQAEEATRVVLRPIANPLAYGFLGLAVATITEGAFDLGWVPARQQHEVALVLVAFAFPVQFLSTVYGFISRDTTAVSGLGLQSVTWLSFGLIQLLGHPGARSEAAAVLLFAAGTVLIVPAAGAALGKVLPAAVISMTALRFVLTGLWEHFGGAAWRNAAGWEGVALFALALYVALATELESMCHRTILPVGRHGNGRQAVTGGLSDQVTHLSNEPGVREQL